MHQQLATLLYSSLTLRISPIFFTCFALFHLTILIDIVHTYFDDSLYFVIALRKLLKVLKYSNSNLQCILLLLLFFSIYLFILTNKNNNEYNECYIYNNFRWILHLSMFFNSIQ